MNPEFETLAKTVAMIASAAIADFARRHQFECFSSFALECDADNCEVYLCLNTEAYLLDRASKAKAAPAKSLFPEFDRMMEEKYGVKPKPLFHDKSVEEVVEMFRWSTADWKYHMFHKCSDHREWRAIEKAFDSVYESDAERERFMEAVCLAVPKLQPAVQVLNRTSDFKCFVIDHDEGAESAWTRMSRVLPNSEQ